MTARREIWDMSAETMSRDRLERLQLVRLRRCYRRVNRRVPFYRHRFSEHADCPKNIETLGDLHHLPFTTKEDILSHPTDHFLAISPERILRFHATSGTTGHPLVMAYSSRDIDLWADLVARVLASAGVRATDIIQNAYSYGLFSGGLGYHYGAEKLGVAVIPISSGNTRRQIQFLLNQKATVICATSSYLSVIAEVAEEAHIDCKDAPLRIAVIGGEPCSEGLRMQLEDRLSLRIADTFGLTEIIGPGVSMECSERNGLHINEDHFIAEVVDPETGRVLPEGETGELVLSSVTKDAMPLLRYRTGDLTFLDRTACECGRTTARMGRVIGRRDDMLVVRGVNVFPGQIEHVLAETSGVTTNFEVVPRARTLVVRVVSTEPIIDEKNRSQLESKLLGRMHSALGLRLDIELVPPATLKRNEGKASRIARDSEATSTC